MAPLVEIQELSRDFREGDRERQVLHGVDAAVEAGEWVALLGRSGSGKSTLLNIVAGIDAPSAGIVRIGGADLHALSEQQRTVFRRRQIGYVFQFFHLLPTLDVLENVLLPLDLDGQPGRASRERAAAMLDRVGMGDRGKAWPDRLSGGEQQRVAIARALVTNPQLLLADEPTGNLDEGSVTAILDLLAGIQAEFGTTILMATHSREAAARASRVLQMHEGRLRPYAGSAR